MKIPAGYICEEIDGVTNCMKYMPDGVVYLLLTLGVCVIGVLLYMLWEFRK